MPVDLRIRARLTGKDFAPIFSIDAHSRTSSLSLSKARTWIDAMRQFATFLLTLVTAVGLVLATIQDAEARRLGGGKSFGGKPGYSTPYRRSARPSRQLTQKQQAAQQHNAQRRTELSRKGGLMGMLGGLALGGLLGALLFGGAFENINFLDILIFALVAFSLYKLFATRARRGMHQTRTAGSPFAAGDNDARLRNAAPEERGTTTDPGRSWGLDSEAMRHKFGGSSEITTNDGTLGDRRSMAEELDADLPKDFDRQAFVAGAERAYRTLQQAWDNGDLDAIRDLTTDAVFTEIASQLSERHGENRTEVVKADGQILEVRRVGSNLQAAVLFDAFVREIDAHTDRGDRGHTVREIWHFVRPVDAHKPTWYLDGIQQLKD
jgi:predicted lipid-binding transport protein (Tim44 family)